MRQEQAQKNLGRAALAGLLAAGLFLWPCTDGLALSRGLAEKMRRMRAGAYAERFGNAAQAFKSQDYAGCVREASLALDHASDIEQANAAHRLLAAAYLKLGDPRSAAPHQAWLTEHQPQKN